MPLTSTPCTDIAPAAVSWLWHPYIARGKLCVLDGDPGTGKSYVALDLAARISRMDLPTGEPHKRPLTSLLLCAEDDAADTIAPRLAAACADLSRVHVVAAMGVGRPALPQFPDDLPTLRELIYDHAADFVVIDPILPFFPRAVWANNDQSVRRALTPFASLAAETGCAILFIRHLTKTGGSKAIYRGGGSIGIVGAVRTALLLSPHPDDETLTVLAATKTNVGPRGASLAFRLIPDPATGELCVVWTGPVDLSANELCGATAQAVRVRPRERAAEWLRAQLANGKRKATDLEAAARNVGIAYRTLHRAKDTLGVVVEKEKADGSHESWWHDPQVSKPKGSWSGLKPLGDLL